MAQWTTSAIVLAALPAGESDLRVQMLTPGQGRIYATAKGALRSRKRFAGLFDLARRGQLDYIQTVVSLSVMVLFVPCIANFFVMIKEHGARIGVSILLGITVYAVVVGYVLNFILRFLGAYF